MVLWQTSAFNFKPKYDTILEVSTTIRVPNLPTQALGGHRWREFCIFGIGGPVGVHALLRLGLIRQKGLLSR